MRDLAQMIVTLPSEANASVARFVDLNGFGGRRSSEAALITSSGIVGSLLGGAADARLRDAHGSETSVLAVELTDNDAVGCGLACGGRASVLVQPTTALPMVAWQWIAEGETVVVATALSRELLGSTLCVRSGGVIEGHLGDAGANEEALVVANQMLSRPKDLQRTITTAAGSVFLTLVRPPTEILVVGEAVLADATARQGALLGWSTRVLSDRGESASFANDASALGAGDALVVLSHDLDVSAAALVGALRGRCGYVGALGSRHTQTARAEVLRAQYQCTPEELARVHGPIGLDLGSRTPEETALAIVAEIVSVLAGRSAANLRDTPGPLNG